MLLDKKCWPGFPSQGRGNLALWGCRKGRGEGDRRKLGVRGGGKNTDLHVRAMLSSAEVPPDCAVTQASLRLYPKQRPPWEKRRQLVLFFHFNGIMIN